MVPAGQYFFTFQLVLIDSWKILEEVRKAVFTDWAQDKYLDMLSNFFIQRKFIIIAFVVANMVNFRGSCIQRKEFEIKTLQKLANFISEKLDLMMVYAIVILKKSSKDFKLRKRAST